MKNWLLFASCLALNLPALASAQPDQGRGDQQQGAKTRPSKPEHGGRPGGAGPGAGGPNRPAPGGGGPGAGGPNRPNPGGPGQGAPNYGGPNRPGQGGPNRPGFGGPNRPGIPNRPNIPPRPSRPNWGWRGRRFRIGAFRYPAGWSYRRWNSGQFLPLLFLSPAYYFTNWVMLGVDPPPPGYVWVRFGPDLLLVQRGTGYIAYVMRGVFY